MKEKPQSKEDIPSFEDECRALERFFRATWDGLADVKPKGYEAFARDYTDFQGMLEYYDTGEAQRRRDLFQGVDDTSQDSSDITVKTSLPHVAYDDKCQGRSPLLTFIAACVSHGWIMGEVCGKAEADEISSVMEIIVPQAIKQKQLVEQLQSENEALRAQLAEKGGDA